MARVLKQCSSSVALLVLIGVVSHATTEWPNDVSNTNFGHTNSSHMSLAHSDVSRHDFMKAKATQRDDYVLLMFDEIVMARDEEGGIEQYVNALIPEGNNPRLLEIGFGMGISADFIHKRGCASHTIIEANADVMKTLVDWRIKRAESSNCLVTPIFGFWEDAVSQLGANTYDGIMYDPHPSTATVPFLKEARRLLRFGGRVVFFLSVYDNRTVAATWRHTKRTLRKAGWHDDEIGKPKLFHGEVMADCGHKYTKPGPTEECPFRPLTYIIPDVKKKKDIPALAGHDTTTKAWSDTRAQSEL